MDLHSYTSCKYFKEKCLKYVINILHYSMQIDQTSSIEINLISIHPVSQSELHVVSIFHPLIRLSSNISPQPTRIHQHKTLIDFSSFICIMKYFHVYFDLPENSVIQLMSDLS